MENTWENEIEIQIKDRISRAEKILVGLGEEWKKDQERHVEKYYELLNHIIKEKDYFIVTLNTDGMIFKTGLDEKRIAAPCGNIHWYQCEAGCTKDIWEEEEAGVLNMVCPHCKKRLTPNTAECENYIEEGYLPQWKAYTEWLSRTLNKELLVLEMGAGFKYPSVMRWPFEKTVFFNKKAFLCRVGEKFYQISEEMGEKGLGICENSLNFLMKVGK
ncbi:hypothetical protein [Lachnoclostridium edouardi]|uniref:hypothetical protein n=1 Tax=Lachnoclostridium edouardi TaxID=1926283 RepID=UPI000C7CA408|nr:hypothetical protein [Lachnoclostridium edouardi]